MSESHSHCAPTLLPVSSGCAPADTLRSMGACEEAIRWVESSPDQSPEALWRTCHRGDWMLWYAGRAGVDRRTLVRAACACARLTLGYVRDGEDRPLRAIEIAEAWARGEATRDQVSTAARAAFLAAAYAARAADAASVVAAAFAAAYAAEAAYYDYAADAASAAADAPYSADVRADIRRRCADAVREVLPEVPL